MHRVIEENIVNGEKEQSKKSFVHKLTSHHVLLCDTIQGTDYIFPLSVYQTEPPGSSELTCSQKEGVDLRSKR